MLVASFPFYVKHLGGDDALAGLVAGLFGLAALLARPLVGWALDNKSRRLPLMLGAAGLAVLAVAYSQVSWLALIVLLRLVHGVAWAGANTGNNTNACDHVPPGRFAEGMGYFGVTQTVSMATAPALGLFLKDNFGFPTLFLCSAAIAVCALVMTFFVDFKPLPIRLKQPFSRTVRGLYEKSALPASLTVLFFIIPYGAINTFIALYAVASGLGSGGLYFSIVAFSCVFMRLFGGRLADKAGERPIIYLGSGSLAISMLLLVLIKTTAAFLLSALVFGIGFGIMPPAMQAFAMRIAKPENRGAASSTYMSSFDIGIALGGAVSGFLVKYFGFGAMFACMLIPQACCFLVYTLWAAKSPAAFKRQAVFKK
jgi:MFS family permease